MDQEPKYMFRPIAEDATVASIEASMGVSEVRDPMGGDQQSSAASVLDHVASIRPQMTMSPNRPKLYSCWRRSEEAWSSTGSRHSSRPGSSTASSSRPPSQPNIQASGGCQAAQLPAASATTGQQQGGGAPPCNGLYCKSNNSSTSDVSVARNFQQLSVSSRRALFKTQKWSHSFDQANLSVQAQMSPGRRRAQVLPQQNKSLDLDSGYSGSWTGPPGYQQSNVATTNPPERVKRLSAYLWSSILLVWCQK